MPYRTFSVSTQKDEGFQLNLIERSVLAAGAEYVVGNLCSLLGHPSFLENTLTQWVGKWIMKSDKTLHSVPTTRATADKLAHKPDTWSWMD